MVVRSSATAAIEDVWKYEVVDGSCISLKKSLERIVAEEGCDLSKVEMEKTVKDHNENDKNTYSYIEALCVEYNIEGADPIERYRALKQYFNTPVDPPPILANFKREWEDGTLNTNGDADASEFYRIVNKFVAGTITIDKGQYTDAGIQDLIVESMTLSSPKVKDQKVKEPKDMKGMMTKYISNCKRRMEPMYTRVRENEDVNSRKTISKSWRKSGMANHMLLDIGDCVRLAVTSFDSSATKMAQLLDIRQNISHIDNLLSDTYITTLKKDEIEKLKVDKRKLSKYLTQEQFLVRQPNDKSNTFVPQCSRDWQACGPLARKEEKNSMSKSTRSFSVNYSEQVFKVMGTFHALHCNDTNRDDCVMHKNIHTKQKQNMKLNDEEIYYASNIKYKIEKHENQIASDGHSETLIENKKYSRNELLYIGLGGVEQNNDEYEYYNSVGFPSRHRVEASLCI